MTSPENDIPHDCLAAVFVGPGRPLEIRRLPVPEPLGGEALVRVECCTICGSDLHTITGPRSEPVPSILGHEILGVVAAVGDPAPADVDGVALRPGDRITWSTSVSCGECDRCRGGLPQKCRTLAKYGHETAEGRYALSGGLSEYLLLRRGSAAIRIPPDLPAELMCPVNCATATIAAAFRTAGFPAGRRVLIFGAGMLGITAAAFAASHGAALVALCDPDTRRLERAAPFGAVGVPSHPETEELLRRLESRCGTGLFDVIVELSGSPDGVEAAFRAADLGAHIVLVGSVLKSRPAVIDPENVVRRWLTIQGVHNYRPDDLRTAVGFLERFGREYPFADLVEFTHPLTEVNAALEQALRTRPVRVAIRP